MTVETVEAVHLPFLSVRDTKTRDPNVPKNHSPAILTIILKWFQRIKFHNNKMTLIFFVIVNALPDKKLKDDNRGKCI